jgi:hypothetical protein
MLAEIAAFLPAGLALKQKYQLKLFSQVENRKDCIKKVMAMSGDKNAIQ